MAIGVKKLDNIFNARRRGAAADFDFTLSNLTFKPSEEPEDLDDADIIEQNHAKKTGDAPKEYSTIKVNGRGKKEADVTNKVGDINNEEIGKVPEGLDIGSAEKLGGIEEEKEILELGNEDIIEQIDVPKSPERQKIEEDLAEARKEYVEIEHHKNNALGRVRAFFGHYIRKETVTPDKEIAEAKKKYNDRLREYGYLLMTEAKASNASNLELAQIAKVFAAETSLNLIDTRTDVKIEQSPRLVTGCKMVLDIYRSLSWKQKAVISALFLGYGALGATIGITATGVAAVLAGKRIFGGLVAGTSLTAGLELRDRSKTEQALEKKNQDFLEVVDKMSPEDAYMKLIEEMKGCIQESDGKIAELRLKEAKNFTAGVLAFGLLGSGAAAWFVKGAGHLAGDIGHWAGEKTGLGNVVAGAGRSLRESLGANASENTTTAAWRSLKGFFGFTTTEHISDEAGTTSGTAIAAGLDNVTHAPIASGLPTGSEQMTAYAAAAPSGSTVMENITHAPVSAVAMDSGVHSPSGLPTGSGLPGHEVAGAAAKAAGADLEFKKGDSFYKVLTKHLEGTGLTHEEAVHKAANMGEVYAREHGLEHGPQSLVHVGAHLHIDASGHIELTNDAQAGYLPETHGGGESTVTHAAEQHATSSVSDSVHELQDKLSQIDTQIEQGVGNVDDLIGQKQTLENSLETIYTANEIAGVRKIVSGGSWEIWNSIQNKAANEVVVDSDSPAYKIYKGIMGSKDKSEQMTQLKKFIDPRRGESFSAWINRSVRYAKKMGLMQYFIKK